VEEKCLDFSEPQPVVSEHRARSTSRDSYNCDRFKGIFNKSHTSLILAKRGKCCALFCMQAKVCKDQIHVMGEVATPDLWNMKLDRMSKKSLLNPTKKEITMFSRKSRAIGSPTLQENKKTYYYLRKITIRKRKV